jgi:diguanylate cyclase (GGDEF)-like protein
MAAHKHPRGHAAPPATAGSPLTPLTPTQLHGAFEAAACAVVVLDARARVVDANPAALRLLGVDRAELAGGGALPAGWRLLRADGHPLPRRQHPVLCTLRTGQPVQAFEVGLQRPGGPPCWFAVDTRALAEGAGVVASFVAAPAGTDRLTGLPDRHAARQQLQALAQATAAGDGHGLALMLLQVDRLQLIDITLGGSAADDLLREVVTRLRRALAQQPARWQLARLGGGRFMLLAPGLCRAGPAREVADGLLAALERPHTLQGQAVHAGARIGVALGGCTPADADTLLREAGAALYEAGRGGRAAVVVADEGMRARLTRELQIEAALHGALAQQQMLLLYQPIVDLDSGRLSSAEALLRWQHPALGAVSPAEFVPIAEASGLVVALGEWALRQACHQWTRWQREDASQAPATVSVNLSRVQLMLGPALIDTVRSALDDAGMPPQALQLEITEREFVQGDADAVDRRALLQGLRALGVRLAMDDFGTGASSLACLREYPFHTIKIDKAFITDLCQDRDVMAVAYATVNVIVNLGMVSVAEGIEEPSEVAALQALGCGYGQGYLFGRPMAGDALLPHMARR